MTSGRIPFYSVLFCCLFTACRYTNKQCQKAYDKLSRDTFDMIIVPGTPISDQRLYNILISRIYWSKFLYDKGIAKNIMYSGCAVRTPYLESVVMAMYAEAIGVPKQHIYTETKAEHSTENVYYSYKYSKKLGFNKIALASDPFQSKLLRFYIKRRVTKHLPAIPVVYDTLKVLTASMTNPVLDTQRARVANFLPLEKRERWWERFKGTFGKNVNKSFYE